MGCDAAGGGGQSGKPGASTAEATMNGPTAASSQAAAASDAPTTSAVRTGPAAVAKTMDPAASTMDFDDMVGRWVVTGVAVPADGVQAFVDDDPAYMGRVMVIDAGRLSWDPAKPAGDATIEDRCERPATLPQTGEAAAGYSRRYAAELRHLRAGAATPHAVECDVGNWGPEAAGGSVLFPVDAHNFAMTWYDEVVLKLTRQS